MMDAGQNCVMTKPHKAAIKRRARGFEARVRGRWGVLVLVWVMAAAGFWHARVVLSDEYLAIAPELVSQDMTTLGVSAFDKAISVKYTPSPLSATATIEIGEVGVDVDIGYPGSDIINIFTSKEETLASVTGCVVDALFEWSTSIADEPPAYLVFKEGGITLSVDTEVLGVTVCGEAATSDYKAKFGAVLDVSTEPSGTFSTIQTYWVSVQ